MGGKFQSNSYINLNGEAALKY